MYENMDIQDKDNNSLIGRYSRGGFHLTSGNLLRWFCRSDRSTGTLYTYLEEGGERERTDQLAGG